ELTSAEWEALLTVLKWLKAFRSATTEMSTTKLPMLSTTHAIFQGLQHHLKTLISTLLSSADPALKEGLVNANRRLSDYFTKFDESQYCTWAALLDPRISYEALHKNYADDTDLLGDLEISKATLETHFDANYADTTTDPSEPASALLNPADRHKWGAEFHISSSTRSAVTVEHIFSGGHNTIGLRRASLKAETIKTLMFVKARLRLARKAIIDLVGDGEDRVYT
ncbi:hypothetical protein DFH08DRAFT_711545, partial [Mycena albidolilacea]